MKSKYKKGKSLSKSVTFDESWDAKTKLSTQPFYTSSEEQTSPQVKSIMENMKRGGYTKPLYHMAGGGPLFLTPGITNMDTTGLSQGKAQQDGGGNERTSTAAKEPNIDMVSGDIQQGENLLNAANKAYSEAILRYGGDTKMAAQDPYVKQAMAAATPNVWDFAMKKRRKENFDLYKSDITDELNPKGNQLDTAEIEKYYLKTGKVMPVNVGQTFYEYEHTPLNELNSNVLGSSWDKQGKVVGNEKDFRDELNEIFKPAEKSLKTGQSTIYASLEDMLSPLGDKMVEQFHTVTKETHSNEDALNTAASLISTTGSSKMNDLLKQKYLATHRDEDGNPIMYIDKDGNYTDEFLKFKTAVITGELVQRIDLLDKRSSNYSHIRDEEWDAGTGQVKVKIRPWENPMKNIHEGSQFVPMNQAVPNKDGTTTYKGIPVEVYTATTDEINDMGQYLGKSLKEFNPLGTFRGVNGGVNRIGDTQLGIITNIEGGLYKLPKIPLDGHGNPIVVDPTSTKTEDLGTFAKVTIAFSAADLKNNNIGDYLPKGATVDMIKTSYDIDKSQQEHPEMNYESTGIGSNLNAVHAAYGAKDTNNNDFKKTPFPNGGKKEDGTPITYDDIYHLTDVNFSDDVIEVIAYIPVNDAWIYESEGAGASPIKNASAPAVNPKNIITVKKPK